MTNQLQQARDVYHQRPASTAAVALCGVDAPPERTLNNLRAELPKPGRMCLRCVRKMLKLRITTRMM